VWERVYHSTCLDAHHSFYCISLHCVAGLYRLCGSATKKRILREAFERNARTVDLSPDNVPDINVITGKNRKCMF
jgi:hypothetical protein